MSENEERRTSWACGWALLDATLAFVILATATSSLELFLGSAPAGIVSRITRARYHPLTNYLKYAIIAGGSAVSFLVAARRRTSVVVSSATTVVRTLGRIPPGRRWTALGVLAVAAFAVLVVNRTAIDPVAPLVDSYHEGERLGFLPAVRVSPHPFPEIFLIHGFGPDVLPSVVADRLAPRGHQIALTRLVLAFQQALGHLFAVLIVVLAARLEGPATSSRPRVAGALACLVALALVFRIDVRDTAYLLQLLLIMLFLAAAQTGRRGITLTAAVVVGLSLPLAFLYVYDRALYMLAATALIGLLLLAVDRRVGLRWFAGLGVGSVAGVATVVVTMGTTGAAAIVDQVTYWVRYSTYINAQQLFGSSSCCETPGIRDLVLLATPTVGLCLAATFVWCEREPRGGLRAAIAAHLPIAVLLVTSVVFLRLALERSGPRNFHFAAVPPTLLLAVLVGTALAARAADSKPASTTPRSPAAIVVMLIVAFGLGLLAARARVLNPVTLAQPLNLWSALAALREWRHAVAADLDVLRPDVREAVMALGQEVRLSRCFFTLTSEGTWYYLFDLPSCSRFHHLMYARTDSAQREVVEALARNRPGVVLFSNNRDMSFIERVSVFNTNAAVAQYVMGAYRPYRLIGGHHWFWRRADEPYRFVDDPAGALDPWPFTADARKDVVLAGTLSVAPEAPETAAIFVTLGSPPTPIWAGHTVHIANAKLRFTADIPTTALPRGANAVDVWLMTNPGGALRPLGTATIDVR